MTVEKELFFKSEKGIGNEDWYYLAKDSETGEEYVLHEWSHGGVKGYTSREEKLVLAEFLKKFGTAQAHLRELLQKRAS